MIAFVSFSFEFDDIDCFIRNFDLHDTSKCNQTHKNKNTVPWQPCRQVGAVAWLKSRVYAAYLARAQRVCKAALCNDKW